jgi:hypothetical protein
MPGPIQTPRIILLNAEAGTTAGPAIGLQGDTIQFTGSRTMRIPIVIVVTLTGGTSATVLIETSNTQAIGSPNTWGTFTLTTAAPSQKFVGRLGHIYIRARPTANVGGGTISAYMRVGVQ